MARKFIKQLPDIDLGTEPIGQRIARLRKKQGLSQSELAAIIGIDRTLITDYERNKIRIYSEMLARFAIALHISIDELVGLKKTGNGSYSPSLKIIRRMKKIEEFSADKQRKIFQNLDLLIKAVEK